MLAVLLRRITSTSVQSCVTYFVGALVLLSSISLNYSLEICVLLFHLCMYKDIKFRIRFFSVFNRFSKYLKDTYLKER